VPGGYVLDVGAEDTDVAAFEHGVTAGTAALRRGDAALAARELRRALELWRGPALAEFADTPFLRLEAGRLEELRLGALEARVDAELELGRHAELVGELGRLVAEHPYQERLRAQLVLALYRSGRQADALAEYGRVRERLVDDLGLEPGDELQRLQQAILAHDPSLGAPAAAPALELAAPARPERKAVTAVVTTLSASEGDPEDLRALLSPREALVSEELARFGAAVSSGLGGAVVGVFGAPVVHEDDPERAVRAALAIREHAGNDPRVEVRAAVATGDVVVGPDAGDGVAADVAGAALRLSAASSPNSVLVDERTFRQTRGTIAYRTATGGGASWEAVSARVGIRADAPPRTQLVGRERELALLSDALERVCESSSPALATVVGPPGIGKSRLAYELVLRAESAHDSPRVLRGRSLPYGAEASFWALGEIVKSLFGIV
jgi:DNA-binding SARP family transcriptional activator